MLNSETSKEKKMKKCKKTETEMPTAWIVSFGFKVTERLGFKKSSKEIEKKLSAAVNKFLKPARNRARVDCIYVGRGDDASFPHICFDVYADAHGEGVNSPDAIRDEILTMAGFSPAEVDKDRDGDRASAVFEL